MSDAVIALIASVAGVAILAVTVVCIAVKKGRPSAISWRGFGVTFTVSPCADCGRDARKEANHGTNT